MVRAILEGRKTQTRRPVRNPERYGCLTGDCPHERQADCDATMSELGHPVIGGVGDRLWVRETFGEDYTGITSVQGQAIAKASLIYRADNDNMSNVGSGWKPSIHMPRWASRITLEVTSVRVERLNQISEQDVVAEGLPPDLTRYSQRAFAILWDSIYGGNLHHGGGPEAWVHNPWVWVVEFKRA